MVRIPPNSRIFHPKKIHSKSKIEGMWWHDDVPNHCCIRNCNNTISNTSMMDVRNSHGSGECRSHTWMEAVPVRLVCWETQINYYFLNSPRGSGRQGQVVTDHRVSLPPSGHSTLTRHQINQVIPNLHHPRSAQSPPPPYEPRLVFPVLKKSGDLGVR